MRGKTTEKTPELNKQIVDLYNSGMTRQQVSMKVHVNTKYVAQVLDELNIPSREHSRKFDYDKIAEHYIISQNLNVTAKAFNTSSETVKNAVLSKGISIYHKPKVKFNNKVFDKINTQEKAYWLGFIYADGYIAKGNGQWQVSIVLNAKDYNHLQKFCDFIKCDYSIIKEKTTKCNGKTYKSYKISISDKHLWESLVNKGAVNRKSYILKFPNYSIVPRNLIKHFIRGYFDGDGCIMTKETSASKLQISIVGTHNMMDGIRNWMKSESSLIAQDTKNTTVWYLRYKILWSIKFCEKIYDHAKVYLDRKFLLWDNFCRSNMKMLDGLRGKFGKNWDVNAEVIHYVNYKEYCNA